MFQCGDTFFKTKKNWICTRISFSSAAKKVTLVTKNSEYELTQVVVKQRKGFLNNILETEGFFQQMEVTVREKGRSSEEFKLLRDALYGMAAYLQFLDKGHRVGLAAEIRKAIPGHKIYRMFGEYFGLVQVVASVEYWEEKYRLSRMEHAILTVGSGFNVTLSKQMNLMHLY